VSVTTYTVQVSTDGVDFGGVPPESVSASTAPSGSDPQYTFSGLSANTTYFFRVNAVNNEGLATAYVNLGSTSTLAAAVSGTQVAGVWMTSITVNWLPLPSSPPEQTAEGYVLEYSTNSDFNTLWGSSRTTVIALSTLTAVGLTGGYTYYHRVGSLNWSNQANYAASVNAVLAAVYAVEVDVTSWAIGMLVPGGESVQPGVVSVTNAGNVAQNYQLRLIEPNATWNATAAAPGAETYRFSAIFSTAAAATGNFVAPEDVVLTVNATAGAADYAKNDEDVSVKGYSVSAGGARNLRMKFEAPTATDITTPQSIIIRVTTGP
jgi:hypothetical protein